MYFGMFVSSNVLSLRQLSSTRIFYSPRKCPSFSATFQLHKGVGAHQTIALGDFAVTFT